MALRLPVSERLIPELLKRQAETRGSDLYITSGQRRLTFAETEVNVRRIAGGLAELGLAKGDHVGLMLPNGVEFVLSWFACSWLGAVSVAINPTYKASLLEYVIRDSGAQGLIVHQDLLHAVNGLAPDVLSSLRWVSIVEEHASTPSIPEYSGKVFSFQKLAGSCSSAPKVKLDPYDPNCVFYTSGTTGVSKGVMLSSAALIAGSCTFSNIVDLRSSDVLFTPMPLFHGIATRQGVVPCLITGAQIVIAPRFSASRFWDQVCAAGATLAHTMFNIPPMLKAQPVRAVERQHTLRAMYNASHDGAFEERFGVRLLESYGLIETGITIYSPYGERRWGSCGRLHPEWEAMIVDERGEPTTPGQPGELWLRPNGRGLMMEGYLNKPEETLRACRDLWFRTGDFLSRDEDGFFYFAGRQKERIRRRGENISAWEIERIVYGHPDVELCAAVGHPAEVGDDDVRLVVTLKPGAALDPEILMAWLDERMPPFMLPRYIELVPDLPVTPTEKVQKSALIAQGLGTGAWDRETAGYRVRGKDKQSG